MSNGSNDGFIFINACGTSMDHKASTLARAFVMRNIRTTQKWTKRGKRTTDPAEPKLGCDCGSEQAHSTLDLEVVLQSELSIVRPRQPKWLLCRHCQKRRRCSDTQPAASFLCASCQGGPRTAVVGKLDPFSCMAVRFDEKSNILLAYFMSAIAPDLFPVASTPKLTAVQKFHQCWLSPSLKQPAFVHSLLCLTALQLAIMQPTMKPSPSAMAAYHRVQAIRSLKIALSDPEHAVSEETVAAVFHLLCFEENLFIPSLVMDHARPDVSQRAAHVAGLKELIRLRGGIGGLSTRTGKMLQLLILRHSVAHVATSFHTAYRVPRTLLDDLYKYPRSSQFFNDPTPVSDRCRSVGMDPSLIEMVQCCECLFKDTERYAQDPRKSPFEDKDMQILFSGQVGVLLGWYLEAEAAGTLLPAEGLVVFGTAYLLAILYKSKFIATSSAREQALPRMHRNLQDPQAMETLHTAGLDVWVAIVAVSMGNGFYATDFWTAWLETLARQSPPILSFDDLRQVLSNGIWIGSSHDIYAECVWEKTLLEREQLRNVSDSSGQDDPYSWSLEEVASKFTSSNPYVNFQTLSWTPLDEGGSEYAL